MKLTTKQKTMLGFAMAQLALVYSVTYLPFPATPGPVRRSTGTGRRAVDRTATFKEVGSACKAIS
ncbi:MAG: hypothetical protein U0744_08210 [Gemmataceae bacterium]